MDATGRTYAIWPIYEITQSLNYGQDPTQGQYLAKRSCLEFKVFLFLDWLP